MLKILFSIIIYCLYAVQINAQHQQQQQVIILLQQVKDNIRIIDSNLSDTCLKKIGNFKKNFQKEDITVLNKKTISQVLSKANQLIASYKSPDENCNKDTVKRLDDSTKQLIKKLKIVVNQIKVFSTKKAVQLAISIVDDSTKKPLNSEINIITAGSVDTLETLVEKVKDTDGFFNALLLPKKKYLITVQDSLYNKYSSELSIRKDTAIIIKLKRKAFIATGGANKQDQDSNKSNTSQTFISNHTLLFALIAVLFLLALAGVTIYIVKLKSNATSKNEQIKSGFTTISRLEEEIKTKDLMINMINNNLIVAESSLEEIKKEQPAAMSIEQARTPGLAEANRNFICEIMMTAGPRKKFMSEPDADKDLGEDICGFVSDTKDILLWVLDGTSDLHCLKNPADKREYFSSRLLAQFLAEKLRKGFGEKSQRGFDEIVTEAAQQVKEDFLEQINQLPDEEKMFLKKNIENKNFPECATTILIARLSLNGDFIAYRSGDSKMLLFTISPENEINIVETSLANKNDQSNDRLFFRLALDDKGKFDIIFNHPDFEIIKEKNIITTISFSDGVGLNTEILLKDEYKKNPGKIRKEIMYQLQGTGDDKSICFIEIKEIK